MKFSQDLVVLRERSFARYLAANTISQLGGGMATVALAFAVLEFGGAMDLGIVLLGREVPVVILLLLGGVFADRLSRRAIMVGSDLVKGVAQVGTAALLFTGNANVWNIAALQVAFGVAAAFSRPAQVGMVKDSVSDEHLQEANALLHLASSTLQIVGPALGALVVAMGSPATAITADAATFFISAALISSMRIPPVARAAAKSILGDLHDGWREFITRPWTVAMVASFGLFQLSYFPALLVLGPLVAKNQLGGPGAWGLILAVESAGAVIGGLFALRLRFTRILVASELFVLPAGLLLAALAVPLPLPAIAAVALTTGIGFAIGDTLWTTALQRNVPEHALSRISSFDWLGSVALNPIGYALIGPIAVAVGTPQALGVAAALNMATCVGVVLLPSVQAIRGGETAPAAEAAEPIHDHTATGTVVPPAGADDVA
ncbi:MAG TPA: MFS transporter [Candidatus Limnocylindria bacterium]|nr:MFS transporter [Candidatus Limnocylindria bacterium]